LPSGPEVDGGGFIFVNGVPVWVPPWTGPDGPYVRAVQDIYVGLATLQTASMIEHAQTRETIQKTAVDLISEQSKTLSKAESLDLRALNGNAQAKGGAKVQR
jgi:hypothetical protein